MKGYRLTRKGWIVLFTLAFIGMIALFMAISAIIGNIHNIVKSVETSEKKVEQKKEEKKTPEPTRTGPIELTKENASVVIYFGEGSVGISKENLPVLDMIVKASKGQERYKYLIIAYTYGTDDKISEQRLEKQEILTVAREKAIRDYLVKMGISDDKIGIRENAQETKAPADGPLDKEKSIRRVEIHLMGEATP